MIPRGGAAAGGACSSLTMLSFYLGGLLLAVVGRSTLAGGYSGFAGACLASSFRGRSGRLRSSFLRSSPPRLSSSRLRRRGSSSCFLGSSGLFRSSRRRSLLSSYRLRGSSRFGSSERLRSSRLAGSSRLGSSYRGSSLRFFRSSLAGSAGGL